MKNMNVERRNVPDTDQLSVLLVLVLFVYALSPYLKVAARVWEIRLPFIVFDITIGENLLVSIFAATFAAIGTDWILRRHPKNTGKPLIQHQLIPAMTAWVIGIPLTASPVDLSWWIVFSVGGVFLLLVIVAEYMVFDVSDVRYTPAAIGLTAVSFALFSLLVISLRMMNIRLYALLPIVGLAVFFVALRTLYLRLEGRWCFAWSFGITLIVGQIFAGMHYLPLPPIVFGIILTGVAYVLTAFAGTLLESGYWQQIWIEPILVLTLMGFGVILLVQSY